MTHRHEMVLVGFLQGQHGGQYPLRWCRECGTLVEVLDSGAAEMIPQMARDHHGVQKSAPQRLAPMGPGPKRTRKPHIRLGRGLKDLL